MFTSSAVVEQKSPDNKLEWKEVVTVRGPLRCVGTRMGSDLQKNTDEQVAVVIMMMIVSLHCLPLKSRMTKCSRWSFVLAG